MIVDPGCFRVPDGGNNALNGSECRGVAVHTRFFEFFTVYGRGVKAKMEVPNDDKSMKSIELSI